MNKNNIAHSIVSICDAIILCFVAIFACFVFFMPFWFILALSAINRVAAKCYCENIIYDGSTFECIGEYCDTPFQISFWPWVIVGYAIPFAILMVIVIWRIIDWAYETCRKNENG